MALKPVTAALVPDPGGLMTFDTPGRVGAGNGLLLSALAVAIVFAARPEIDPVVDVSTREARAFDRNGLEKGLDDANREESPLHAAAPRAMTLTDAAFDSRIQLVNATRERMGTPERNATRTAAIKARSG